MESTKIVSTGLCSLRAPCRPLNVPKQKVMPVAKAPGQANRTLSQKDWGVFQSAAWQCPGGMVACQELPLQVLESRGTQKHELLLGSRARRSRGRHCAAAAELGHLMW